MSGPGLDIAANRAARKWSAAELAGRALWECLGFAFAWSPRQLWAWRNFMLRAFGAQIGPGVRIHPSVRIAVPWNLAAGRNSAVGDRAVLYNLGRITLGANVTVSQHAHLCAGTGAWICADAFVGPDVSIGDHAIVAARAVAVRDVEPWTIVAGNPARLVGPRPPLDAP
ncbi:MAG: hypothetical protein ABSD80_16750 [Caulobacteraceae bacterium]